MMNRFQFFLIPLILFAFQGCEERSADAMKEERQETKRDILLEKFLDSPGRCNWVGTGSLNECVRNRMKQFGEMDAKKRFIHGYRMTLLSISLVDVPEDQLNVVAPQYMQLLREAFQISSEAKFGDLENLDFALQLFPVLNEQILAFERKDKNLLNEMRVNGKRADIRLGIKCIKAIQDEIVSQYVDLGGSRFASCLEPLSQRERRVLLNRVKLIIGRKPNLE